MVPEVNSCCRLRVGYVVSSISRVAGGLQHSVLGLARAVAAAGVDVRVFSAEDEYSDIDLPAWNGIRVDLFPKSGLRSFCYMQGLQSALYAADVDILHTQGIWQYPSLAVLNWHKKTGQPYAVSPRGMLDYWALSNSRWKKLIAARMYEGEHMRCAALIHALASSEESAVRRFGVNGKIAVIPNGVWVHGDQRKVRKKGDVSTLLFLGRIHPKKGLRNLIEAWALSRRAKDNLSWRLVIAGWDQNGHEAELKGLAFRLGVMESIDFVGPKFGDEKDQLLSSSSAFVLPSYSEGLPMAVLEAWSYGLPVLMTKFCNLSDGFDAGAALELSLEPKAIAVMLSELFSKSDDELEAIGRNAQKLVRDRFSWPTIGHEMSRAYCAIVKDSHYGRHRHPVG